MKLGLLACGAMIVLALGALVVAMRAPRAPVAIDGPARLTPAIISSPPVADPRARPATTIDGGVRSRSLAAPAPRMPRPRDIDAGPAAAKSSTLPLVLPSTPRLEEAFKQLEQNGTKDAHHIYEYYLPFYAHIDGCAGPSITEKGAVLFRLFLVDDDHVAHTDRLEVERSDLGNEATALFERCAKEYFSSHTALTPSYNLNERNELTWAGWCRFPVKDNWIYQQIGP